MPRFKSKQAGAIPYGFDAPLMMTYRPKRRSDALTRVIDGTTTVLDREKEFVHQFNKTASYIWDRCNGHRTPEEITYELCTVFDIDFPTARKDVIATVEQLRRSKLLEGS